MELSLALSPCRACSPSPLVADQSCKLLAICSWGLACLDIQFKHSPLHGGPLLGRDGGCIPFQRGYPLVSLAAQRANAQPPCPARLADPKREQRPLPQAFLDLGCPLLLHFHPAEACLPVCTEEQGLGGSYLSLSVVPVNSRPWACGFSVGVCVEVLIAVLWLCWWCLFMIFFKKNTVLVFQLLVSRHKIYNIGNIFKKKTEMRGTVRQGSTVFWEQMEARKGPDCCFF